MRTATSIACGMMLSLVAAPAAPAQNITVAAYSAPTTRYAHGVLGDFIEFGALTLILENGETRTITLRHDRVFEDVAPRLIDLDGDGAPEVIVVETQKDTGAQLAIYGPDGKIAATPHIGTANRWLAPVGAADLDGDGKIEIAYVDRPHLAKILRVWRYDAGTLTEVATAAGLTNHRIGEADIAGGIRNCEAVPEMIVADANWRRLLAVTLSGRKLTITDIGLHSDRNSFAAAMSC